MAALADDIAYHSHDLDDGLRAGLFGQDEIAHLPVVREALAEARRASLDEHPTRLRHETIRRVIDRFVTDFTAETARRIAARAPADADAIRRAKQPVVAFSPAMAEANHAIREFLYAAHVPSLAGEPDGAQGAAAHAGPVRDPQRRSLAAAGRVARTRPTSAGPARTALTVCDYIAGMTDRFAIDEHRRLTDLNASG